MKASDFEVGCGVKDSGTQVRGKVIGNKLSDGDEVVAVEWDDGTLTKMNVDELSVIDDDLEEHFAAVQLKITEAAKALKEANALLAARGHFTLDFIDLSGLMKEIRNAGWSTSSMRC